MGSERPDSFMPMWWGDYFKDTQHLLAADHGAYLLLIARYWITGEALDDEDDELRSIAKMERAEWKKARPKIAKFFRVADGKWSHKRIDRELLKAREKYQRRVEASRTANEKRWKSSDQSSETDAQSDSETDPKRTPQDHPDGGSHVRDNSQLTTHSSSSKNNSPHTPRRRGARSGTIDENAGDTRDEARVHGFKTSGFWPPLAGPKPDQPGCTVKLEILQRHGFRQVEAVQ